jgi:hypothetical protein
MSTILVLCSIFLFVISLAWISISIDNIKEAMESNSWQKTPATIIKSDINVKKSSKKNNMWCTDIVFQYSYGQAVLQSSQAKIEPGKSCHLYSSAAKKEISKYPENSRIYVYVNPHNPKNAVLVTGLNFRTWFHLGCGIALFLASFATIYVAVIFNRVPIEIAEHNKSSQPTR